MAPAISSGASSVFDRCNPYCRLPAIDCLGPYLDRNENSVLVCGIVVVLVLVVAFGFDFEDEFEDEDEHDVRGCQGQRQGQAIGSTVMENETRILFSSCSS